jgi:polyisoprenoid-binding protein YceI
VDLGCHGDGDRFPGEGGLRHKGQWPVRPVRQCDHGGSLGSESAISVIILTDSVDTGIKMRDAHLKADNVFATVRFPTLEFRSTAIVEAPTGLTVTGTLRIRDITQSVTFDATRSTTAGPPRYNATVVVASKEYGITRLGTTKPVKVILDATLKRA